MKVSGPIMNLQNAVFNSSKINTSLNFGFLGLGMGGNSIAAACAEVSTNIQNKKYPYSAILVNTNQIDLDKIEVDNPKTSKLLIGSGKGAGRDIALGERMYVENSEKVSEKVKEQFKDADFLWIVAGLGGGTGTGSIIEAIRTAMTSGFAKRFGLILTLPRKNEGATVLGNALQRLQQINKAMSGLGSIILVDNQKLFDYFTETKSDATLLSEYLTFANKFVAETLHELNVVTASYKPTAENHFDSSEFENLIKTPGVLHFAKFSKTTSDIAASTSADQVSTFSNNIVEGILSDGYDLTKTSRLAVSILANESSSDRLFNFAFATAIETEINQLAPFANEKPIAYYNYKYQNVKDVYFYAVFAGLQLPSGVTDLVKETMRLKESQQQNSSPSEDIFAGLSIENKNETPSEQSFDDLFGNSSTDEKRNEPAQEDPFSLLFEK